MTVVPAGTAVGPPLFGLIADHYSYDGAWLMTGSFVLIAGINPAWIFRERLVAH